MHIEFIITIMASEAISFEIYEVIDIENQENAHQPVEVYYPISTLSTGRTILYKVDNRTRRLPQNNRPPNKITSKKRTTTTTSFAFVLYFHL